MPHITIPLSSDGCLVELFVGVCALRAGAILALGLQPPSPVRVRALVDTGASGTIIHEQILKDLGLKPTGTTSIHTPSTKGLPEICRTYDIHAAIFHPAFS